MRSVALVALVIACKDAPPAQPKPPGALYFMRERQLVKLEGGKETATFDEVGAPVFPSQHALPDGRVVGIASEGTGEPGSEQLVLIGPGTKVERFGPANTQVRHPAVDPKGAWIVIESKVEPHSELYLIDVATQRATQLTNNPEGNFSPAVLDARTVVFSSSRDGDAEIYKLDVITKEATRLTAFHRDDWNPRPAPDGKTIAFLSDREGRPRIFLVAADGTSLRRLTARRGDAEEDEDDPVWSPDAKSIAYVAGGRLFVHDVTTGDERSLTSPRARDAEPAFSPDGKWIAVSRDDDLYALPIGGGAALRLTKTRPAERLPRWR